MPLTAFQSEVARLLATNKSEDNHLAGGAALHIEPNAKRYSNDLDYFHDSVERVAESYTADSELLKTEGYEVFLDMQQPGYIRARVSKGTDVTKVEWSHDAAWRFLPTEHSDLCGYKLHPIDLALNKLLALVGRDEPRDFIDILYAHENILPLGALVWAAAGKDPGFTPLSLLALLKRRGKYRPEDFSRLHLTETVDVRQLKTQWLEALEAADRFVRSRPPDEIGCLYYAPKRRTFIEPTEGESYEPHYGRPGGVLPNIASGE
ncbi:MAG: hypothetical protein QNJ97_05525 [Myxococcota bacterium]|nr:hypothetical protein [Myxococcota bacterium]